MRRHDSQCSIRHGYWRRGSMIRSVTPTCPVSVHSPSSSSSRVRSTLHWSATSSCWRGPMTTWRSSQSSSTTSSPMMPMRLNTPPYPLTTRWSATSYWLPRTSTCVFLSSRSRNENGWGRRDGEERIRKDRREVPLKHRYLCMSEKKRRAGQKEAKSSVLLQLGLPVTSMCVCLSTCVDGVWLCPKL